MGNMTEDEIEFVQDASYLMTVIIMQIAPRIDEGKTFDILWGFLKGDGTEKRAKAAGKAIRDTMVANESLN